MPMTSSEVGLYRGRHVALLTQHGKEHVIAQVLDIALGCRVEQVAGYDTDLLGTFAQDITRAGTQIGAARKKARMDNIRVASEELARKLSSPCPTCDTPGYWIVERLAGLSCRRCGHPTREIPAEVHGCCKCTHRITIERSDRQDRRSWSLRQLQPMVGVCLNYSTRLNRNFR